MPTEITVNVKVLERLIAELSDAVERVVDEQAHGAHEDARVHRSKKNP
jgi:hypothetical protein